MHSIAMSSFKLKTTNSGGAAVVMPYVAMLYSNLAWSTDPTDRSAKPPNTLAAPGGKHP